MAIKKKDIQIEEKVNIGFFCKYENKNITLKGLYHSGYKKNKEHILELHNKLYVIPEEKLKFMLEKCNCLKFENIYLRKYKDSYRVCYKDKTLIKDYVLRKKMYDTYNKEFEAYLERRNIKVFRVNYINKQGKAEHMNCSIPEHFKEALEQNIGVRNILELNKIQHWCKVAQAKDILIGHGYIIECTKNIKGNFCDKLNLHSKIEQMQLEEITYKLNYAEAHDIWWSSVIYYDGKQALTLHRDKLGRVYFTISTEDNNRYFECELDIEYINEYQPDNNDLQNNISEKLLRKAKNTYNILRKLNYID